MSRLKTYIQTYRHVNIDLEFCEVLTEFAKIKLPEPPPAPRPPSAREQSDERSPSFDLEDVSERKYPQQTLLPTYNLGPTQPQSNPNSLFDQ